MSYPRHTPYDPYDPTSPPGTGPGAVTGPAAGGPGPGLDVSPSGLADLAKLFDVQVTDLNGAMREAAGRLAAIGAFWGGDEAGRKFHEGDGGRAGYGAVAADITSDVRALSTVYDGIGDRLVVMGRNVRAADWASIPRLPEVPR
ncbi:WXG100 family type VII secretion target [Sphaerisporangium corydalis]|uniref:WXG100 family type VII secretion target n=1 Tax=Sphaerisporangium corydalis TaxID=1441875 RepID=A0ABV9E5L5_9ACTN|nr:WXG100 family type VII secretion target [Sphaerisporangium corydalis]